MWFRKKKKLVKWEECVGCGCLMRAARKEVEVERRGSPYDTAITFMIYTSPEDTTESFCGRCAPPYDVKVWIGPTPHYYRKETAREVEVTEKGKAIKEKS